MDISSIYSFLKQLAIHNDREWFAAHKDEYTSVKNEFDLLTAAFIDSVCKFDPEAKGMQPSQCTYRIYRDTRFSQDKTPYKIHMGAYVNPKGKKSTHCGYYLHIQPGCSMLCAGSICWPGNILKAVRQAIVDNIDEYRDIVEDPEFKLYFPVVGDERLKTAPVGFDRNYEFIDYIKPKDFSISCRLSDDFFLQDTDTLMLRVEKILQQAKRFADFTNYTIDDYEE